MTDQEIQRLQNQVANLEGQMAILMSVLTVYTLSVVSTQHMPIHAAIVRVATEIDRRETARLKRG